jgi:hypothetical protein
MVRRSGQSVVSSSSSGEEHGPPQDSIAGRRRRRFFLSGGISHAQQPAQPKPTDPATVTIDDKSIGGVVTSRFGPEAGVWVIAETKDLGTRFAIYMTGPTTFAFVARWCIPGDPPGFYQMRDHEPERRIPAPHHKTS